MIPKVINYCWFGKNPLGEKEKKCIDSWKTFLPDWKIILWNEDNFNVHLNSYVEEAYQARKWAFVSDVARFAVLNETGGIYLDTDVELISDIEDLVHNGAFMGIESSVNGTISVNPGLIIASEPGNPVIKDILDSYANEHFLIGNINTSKYNVVERTTKILKEKYNLDNCNEVQKLKYITIYPKDYFCPMDYATGNFKITNNTRSIHWFNASWLTEKQKNRQLKKQKLNNIFPTVIARPLAFLYLKLGAAGDIFRERGLKGLIARIKG